MRQGLADATGSEMRQIYHLSLLADSCLLVGSIDEGLDVIARALRAVEETGEHAWEAELYRLQGELLLGSEAGSASDAEECFRHSLEIARGQDAKAWQLRSAMSLSRLWEENGRSEEAHRLLLGIYGEFTEGLETHDLLEAKALLQRLEEG